MAGVINRAFQSHLLSLGLVVAASSVAAVKMSTPITAMAYSSSPDEPKKLIALSPAEFKTFPIAKITKVSHNTKIYDIALPSPEHEIGAVTASVIQIMGPGPDGKPTVRPYTPISLNDRKGSFELLIKSYPEGIISKHFDSLKVGDSVQIKGAFTKLPYKANMKKKIGMLAGGTGITPMLQIIQEVINNPDDKTELHLVFANTSEEDILLKDRLDAFAAKHSKQLKITYVVTNTDKSKYIPGHINAEIIKKYMPAPSDDVFIFVCGPPGFMQTMSGPKESIMKQGPLTGLLLDAGYSPDNVVKF